MPLSCDHIPLPCSLRERVSDEFAPDDRSPRRDPLPASEIAEYLGKARDTDGSPLSTIKRRAAKAGRSSELRPEDQAALAWVCEAFDEWEEHYPLEQPLRDHVRRLLPLAISIALSDESFFTPGIHPLHQLLDALQSGAVGWQGRLDRAGQMLEQRVQRSVEKALEWFNDKRLDISAITRELVAANERDAARAQRMVQRLAETEGARLKTLTARREAAIEINEGFAKYDLPAAIGEFLKGPWYDSAQLVLVKHGENSREWEQIRRATRHLMESVQAVPEGDEAGRDRQEQILRHLPGELRRWLISLEHDSDATDGAIGLVEYAHLRIQHGQKLQLADIKPLPVEKLEPAHEDEEHGGLENGSWYRFEDEHGELRAQLVLQLENEQHLLFANFVGLKALDLSRRAFSQRLQDGFATPLPNRETFSLSLASAAGIDSDERLRMLVDPSYRPPQAEAETRPSSETEEEPGFGREVPGGDSPTGAGPGDDRNRSEAEARDNAEDEQDPEEEFDPVLTPPEGAELELSLDEPDEPPAPAPAPQPAAPPPRPVPPSPPPPRPAAAPTPPPPEQPPAAPPPAPAPAPTIPPPAEPRPAEPAAAQPAPVARPLEPVEREVDVPMGAWLGFHDGETPIMAKLAVYDPRRDNYIFVNRKGIALRELSRAELRELIDKGLVDILETRSYFRDEVQRAREEGQ